MTTTLDVFRAEVAQWMHEHLRGEFEPLRGAGGVGDEHYDPALGKRWEQELARGGWVGIGWPEAHGGRGLPLLHQVVFHEEYVRVGGPGRIGHIGETLLAPTLIEFGSAEQQQRFLPGIRNGTQYWAQGYSEPNAGSDLANVQTRARRVGDEWAIDGQKMFCSCAQVADYILLMARTNADAPKHDGISMILLDPKAPGVEIRRLKKLGLKPMDLNEIFLADVRVPVERVVGEVDRGWRNVLKTLDYERCCLSAVNVGAARSCLDKALAYTKEREQFGQKISQFQLTRAKLADMEMEIDAARLLLYRSAALVDRGIPNNKESAIANLYSSEAYVRAALNGMRLMGGWGYLMEFDMQRHYRDSKLAEIGGGTSEILRIVISREMLR